MQLDDGKKILIEISQGSEQAFTRLVDNYSSKLYTYIYRLTRRREVAEEVTQDIFMQLWQTREFLPEVHNLDAYLFILTRNFSVNALKKLIREKDHLQKWLEIAPSSLSDSGWNENHLNLVDQAIGQLSTRQKEVWIMSRRRKMKYQEIARALNISKDTVNEHLQAANRNIVNYLRNNIEGLMLLCCCLLH